jgi:hypothetical protein
VTQLLHTVAASALGLTLASLPFLQYGAAGSHAAQPHADHTSRRGGKLRMVGDYHLEVVYSECRADIYTSDALRRPLRPARATARLGAVGEPTRAMQWHGDHFRLELESCTSSQRDRSAGPLAHIEEISFSVELPHDGTTLRLSDHAALD